MVKYLISGYYGLDNIGDEAILSGMISSLKKYSNNPSFSVLTNNASVTRSLHDVNPVEHSFKRGFKNFGKNVIVKNELGNIIKEIRKCDVFIMGGGSLLQDLKIHYLPALLSQIKIAQLMKKKTVIYGIGAGPIDTAIGKSMIKSILNHADLVTVRDEMSKNVLDNCGVDEVIQTADPAFGINLPNDLTGILPSFGDEADSNYGYLSATSYNWLHDSDIYRNLTSSTQDLSERRQALATIYDDIINEKQCRVVFIPTVKVDHDGYSDIRNKMECRSSVDVAGYSNDINHVITLLANSELLLGMRLHSLILATLLGKPIVPVSYCGKTKSYLELIGLEKLYLDIEELETEEFAHSFKNNFDHVWNNQSLYSVQQRTAAENLRNKALKNAKMVAELVD